MTPHNSTLSSIADKSRSVALNIWSDTLWAHIECGASAKSLGAHGTGQVRNILCEGGLQQQPSQLSSDRSVGLKVMGVSHSTRNIRQDYVGYRQKLVRPAPFCLGQRHRSKKRGLHIVRDRPAPYKLGASHSTGQVRPLTYHAGGAPPLPKLGGLHIEPDRIVPYYVRGRRLYQNSGGFT